MTDAHRAMLRQMQILEDRLLHTDFSNDAASLELLLAEDFEEVSPQGVVTPRAAVLQWLMQKNPAQRWRFSNWQFSELAPAVRCLRYHAVRIVPASQSTGAQHCSLWVFDDALQCWRMHFHQSTKVNQPAQ